RREMRKVFRRRFSGAAAALALLLAACGPRLGGPAPVVSGEPPAPVEPEAVKVRPGQTLSGIAHTYHVPMRVLAEANHLAPPYRIEAGRTLIIPRTDQPAVPVASAPVPGASPAKSEEVAALTRPADVPLDRAAAAPAVPAPTVAAEPLRPDVKPPAAAPMSTPTAAPPAGPPATPA